MTENNGFFNGSMKVIAWVIGLVAVVLICLFAAGLQGNSSTKNTTTENTSMGNTSPESTATDNAITGNNSTGNITAENNSAGNMMNGQTASISIDEAKKIALNHAGKKEAEVTIEKTKQDRENGRVIYEIEFFDDNYEYDYEIDTQGNILKSEKDVNDNFTSDSTEKGANHIGVDRAKEIALSDAKLSAKDVVFQKVKLEKEDGTTVYEIEFRHNNVEYEYEINALNGKIVKWDKDIEG